MPTAGSGKMSFEWTDDKVAQLRRLHATGMSFRNIGFALGVSKNSAIGKARRLRLADRPRPVSQTPKKAPPPPPKPPAPVPPSKDVSLIGLGRNDCHYPTTERIDAPGGFLFCGSRVKEGSPYCEAHHALCLRLMEKKRIR